MNSQSATLYIQTHDMVSRLGNRRHVVYSPGGRPLNTRTKEWYFALGGRPDTVKHGIVVTQLRRTESGRYLTDDGIEIDQRLVRDNIAYRLLRRAMGEHPIDLNRVKLLLEHPELLEYSGKLS